jgi:hypothetical protein
MRQGASGTHSETLIAEIAHIQNPPRHIAVHLSLVGLGAASAAMVAPVGKSVCHGGDKDGAED